MAWIQEMLTKINTLLISIFYLMIVYYAIKELKEKKTMAILKLLLSTAILGYLVLNPQEAVQKLSDFFK